LTHPLKRMIEDMQLRHFSPHTQSAYLRAVLRCAAHASVPPQHLTAERARRYLLYLIRERAASGSLSNQTRSALQFFFHVTRRRDDSLASLPAARGPRRLPVVLSKQEVSRFFAAIRSPKQRAIFMTAYGTGLRVSELVSLRVADIDPDRRLLHVRCGKGGRPRYVKLSPRLLRVLRHYVRICRPADWLFPGARPGKPIDRVTVNRIAERIRRRAGLAKRISAHTFRHTYATHLLEAGTDLRTIQALLGHSQIQTTAIYLQVSDAMIAAAPGLLERLQRHSGRCTTTHPSPQP